MTVPEVKLLSSKKLDKKELQADKALASFLESIKDKKQSISKVVEEAKTALKSVRTTEKQSYATLNKIRSDVVKNTESLTKEITYTAEKTRENIDKSFNEVDEIREKTRKSYNRFNQSYRAAMDGQNSIEARKQDVVARHKVIKNAHEEIATLNIEAHDLSSQIKAARESSVSDSEQVSSIKIRAEEIKTEIENTYHIAIDSAMGGALNARKKEIENTMKFWRATLLFAVFLLVAAIGFLIYLSTKPNDGAQVNLLESVTNRLVYLTPLLFVIFMAYRQYSHERRLLEEYAFKSSMAQTLRSYTVLLSDNYHHVDKADEKILKFLLDSMTNIYDRSSLDDKSGFFYQLIVGSKHVGAQTTIQEGSAELKQTTTNKVTLKNKTAGSTT